MDRLDRLVSRVSPESVVLRDNYHTYVVKDGKVYEKPAKYKQRTYVTKND